MNKKYLIIIGAVIIVAAGFIIKFASAKRVQKQTRFMMDTYVTIQVPGGLSVIPAIKKALDRMEEVDVKFNALNKNSRVYAFNKKNVPIDDPEIIYLTKMALEISEKSGGDYDITLHKLSKLWGFYSEDPRVPEPGEIKAALKHSGYRKIYIKEGKLYKTDPKVQLDYGSIAKGYAVGEAVKVLKNEEIKSALVDAGGDIYAMGKFYGKPWKIGIRNPRGEGVIGALEIEDRAVVSSGDYERFIIKDGRRYCHILSPKTGYSPEELASVTTFSTDPAWADGWSTAIFVMGAKRGIELADRENDLEVMTVDTNMNVEYSRDLGGETTVAGDKGKK